MDIKVDHTVRLHCEFCDFSCGPQVVLDNHLKRNHSNNSNNGERVLSTLAAQVAANEENMRRTMEDVKPTLNASSTSINVNTATSQKRSSDGSVETPGGKKLKEGAANPPAAQPALPVFATPVSPSTQTVVPVTLASLLSPPTAQASQPTTATVATRSAPSHLTTPISSTPLAEHTAPIPPAAESAPQAGTPYTTPLVGSSPIPPAPPAPVFTNEQVQEIARAIRESTEQLIGDRMRNEARGESAAPERAASVGGNAGSGSAQFRVKKEEPADSDDEIEVQQVSFKRPDFNYFEARKSGRVKRMEEFYAQSSSRQASAAPSGPIPAAPINRAPVPPTVSTPAVFPTPGQRLVLPQADLASILAAQLTPEILREALKKQEQALAGASPATPGAATGTANVTSRALLTMPQMPQVMQPSTSRLQNRSRRPRHDRPVGNPDYEFFNGKGSDDCPQCGMQLRGHAMKKRTHYVRFHYSAYFNSITTREVRHNELAKLLNATLGSAGGGLYSGGRACLHCNDRSTYTTRFDLFLHHKKDHANECATFCEEYLRIMPVALADLPDPVMDLHIRAVAVQL